MATQTQPEPALTLDRRELLASAAVATVAGVIPAELTEAAKAAAAVNVAAIPGSEPPALNVCASTARHIQEIVARNKIREEAGLPLLSIPKELRRMKQLADATDFDEFEPSGMRS